MALTDRYDVDEGARTAEPFLDLPRRPDAPRAAVLVLHGGKARSTAPVEPAQLAVRRMQPFARTLAALGDDLAVGQLRYRYRGWNDAEAHPVADVEFALAAVEARFGPVPVVLVGHSMGGRAALRAAGRATVRGVVALAPWLPGTEPVEQLGGRDLVVLHGTRDATTGPGASSRFVERAEPFARRVACLRIPWSGHGMLLRGGPLAPPHGRVRRHHRARRAVRGRARGRPGCPLSRLHAGSGPMTRSRSTGHTQRSTVAVVGAGVSGLTAAYVLQRRDDVTLYEAEPRLGGHAHTHDVVTPDGRVVPIDSGFIVHNRSTYPNLLRLFGELGVETQPSDMSMSVRCDGCGLEYAGARGVGGVFAQPGNTTNPRFLRLLVEVKRFHRQAHGLLDAPDRDGEPVVTLGEFLTSGRYSQYFVRHFMVPLVSCVWSCPPQTALRYPARSLFTFLDHHGALSVTGSPQWRTVVGGSCSYVERAAKELTATELSTPVRAITRVAGGIEIRDDAGDARRFDRVVVATHADDALALLTNPTPAERVALGGLRVVDQRDRPPHRRVAAAPAGPGARVLELPARPLRNRRRRGAGQLPHEPAPPARRAARLRGHSEPGHPRRRRRGAGAHDLHPSRVHDRVGGGAGRAAGPQRRPGRVRRRLPRVGLPRGRVRIRRARGRVVGGRVVKATLYRTRVAHGRTERVHHGFAYGHVMWLVDLDDVPRLPRPLRVLGRFDARDHLGDPERDIRANVDTYLATRGVDLEGGRVLMLANARSWGYAFNPLSVFWCYARGGQLAGVVAEVHNTYGERHCYFLRPDAHGRADATKEFYVSPFFAVDGSYEMTFTEPREECSVAITLRRGEAAATVFRATLDARRDPARPSFLAGSLRHPFASHRVMALIRFEGIRLWLRRLPVVPRPNRGSPIEEGVAS